MAKKFMVAYSIDANGKCTSVHKVANVDEKRFLELQSQQNAYEEKQEQEKRELLERVSHMEETIKFLQQEIKYLKGEEDEKEYSI